MACGVSPWVGGRGALRVAAVRIPTHHMHTWARTHGGVGGARAASCPSPSPLSYPCAFAPVAHCVSSLCSGVWCGGGAWRAFSFGGKHLKPVHTHMPSQTLRRLAFLEAGPLAGSVPRSASVPNLPRAERTAPPLARGPSRHPRPDRGPSPSRPPRTCSAHDLPITMPAARSGYAGAHGARGLTSHRGDS